MLLVLVLLAPGLVVYAIERQNSKPLASSMLLFGLATTFMPLRVLWEAGHSMELGVTMLTDPGRVGLAWVAAGLGWFLEESAQIIARQYTDMAGRHRIAALQKERAQLVDEWGSLDPPAPGQTAIVRNHR